MSSTSPATVLYDSTGTALAVYNNTALVASQPAILFSGLDGYNQVTRYALMGASGQIASAQTSNNVVVLSDATITNPGSDIFTTQLFGTQEISIIVNATVQATGTTPSLTFTIQEVDPGNGTTTYGNSASTTALTNVNTPGVFTATLNVTTSSAVKVSWAISGTTPVFAGVYVTMVTKTTPSTQTINGTVTATNNSVGSDGAAALAFDTQVGGKTTTSAPTYTNGNLDALSLTTAGGLRIDGVYPTTTTTTNAPDMMVSGGYVTTLAPTYTNNTVNALSLDGYGNLRTVAITNKASTSAVTSVAQSTSNTVLLSSNQNRVFASVYNNSGQKMFIRLGIGASNTVYSIQLMPNSYWEVPQDWQGEIDAVWNGAGGGNALVTELTP